MACGGTYTNPSGKITSPAYPNLYPHNAKCDYNILQPKGSCIQLQVNQFETVKTVNLDGSCSTDYLEIKDGILDNSYIIGKYCGINGSNIPPSSIYSSKNYMSLK